MQTHTSGFSIGDKDTDQLKVQLKNLTSTFEEEKERADGVFNTQETELDTNQKEIEEIENNQSKQRARMAELQDELTQTIKRIEQLQRGGGSFGAAANNRSGTRRQFGSGPRAGSYGSNNRTSPYGGRNLSNGSGQRSGGGNTSNTRPVPSYMRPTGGPRVAKPVVPRSTERSGSY